MFNSTDYEDVTELPEFSPKSEFSKARLCESFINKVCELRSREMREGYFNEKVDKEGNIARVWVEDSRKVYCSSVDALVALMTPEIYADVRAKKALGLFKKEKEKLLEKYSYTVKIKKIDENGKYHWVKTKNKYLPRIDEELPIDNPKFKDSKHIIYVKGLWNKKVNYYWDEVVFLYDELFSEINLLIGSKQINYFKSRASF